MASLLSIGRDGIRGTAATPVNKIAINNYAVHNKFMAMQQFENIGTWDGNRNLAASITTFEDSGDTELFRAIGVEHEADNATPTPVVVYLKNLGTSFDSDRAIRRGMAGGVGATATFDEQQMDQAMNRVINGFARASMKAKVSDDARNFDGFEAFFAKNTTQVIEEPHELVGGITPEKALQVERHFNKAVAMVKDCNEIITTRDGATLLRTLNGYRNRGIEAIEVNGLKYNQYMGIPIIELPDGYFEASDIAKGIPLILGYVNSTDGIRYAIPADGQVFDIVPPNTTRNGVFVERGGLEMFTAPIMVDKFVAAKCYITEVPEVPAP